MSEPKRHHSVFGDYYTNTEGLNLEEKQVLVREVEHHNKSVVPRRGTGIPALIVSGLWFVMAIVSLLTHDAVFAILGILGGLGFLVLGLIKRYTRA